MRKGQRGRPKAAVLTWCNNNGPTNYGQILQCYAVQRLVREAGFEPLVVQYRKKDKWDWRNGQFSNRTAAGRFLNGRYERSYHLKVAEGKETLRTKRFEAFIRTWIPRSAPCYTKKMVEEMTADCKILLCGSDQIWNPIHFDPVWFLDFGTPSQKRIACAPSGIFYERPEFEVIYRKMAPLIERLDEVSVREQISADILKRYTDREIRVQEDPVLCLTKSQWDEVAGERMVEERYIFCYLLGSLSPYQMILRELQKRYRAEKIVYIPTNVFSDGGFREWERCGDAGPAEFLSLVKYAEAVCTDSFHGTAVALLYGIPFYNVSRKHKEAELVGGRERIENLLKMRGLDGRWVKNVKDAEKIYKNSGRDPGMGLQEIEGEILIYGAHLVAQECARWLIKKGKRDRIAGFAVTDLLGNPGEIEGIPVHRLEHYESSAGSLTVLIAAPEKYFEEIESYAREKGFCRFQRAGLERMSGLKGEELLRAVQEQREFPFALERDPGDVSWLNLFEKAPSPIEGVPGEERRRHYKFPTLFYLEEERVLAEVLKLDFEKDYEEICGTYRNLHAFPASESGEGAEKKLKGILGMYMAFSSWDSGKAMPYQRKPYLRPLQVGTALSSRKQGEWSDDTGDQISGYNRLFAEMTGAYWVWKNVSDVRYKGLCHYRRHFVISWEEILAMEENGIDVLLTTPRYVPGGLLGMFLAETPVKAPVYRGMIQAITEIAPGDLKDFECYMESCFYYPNNMAAAKSEIYNAYCQWIFPILFRMLEIDRGTGYGHENDRHIAYAAELLTSFYFVKKKEEFRIAVTDYQFYR